MTLSNEVECDETYDRAHMYQRNVAFRAPREKPIHRRTIRPVGVRTLDLRAKELRVRERGRRTRGGDERRHPGAITRKHHRLG